MRGYHPSGFNVLYADFHAKWIYDAGQKIQKADVPMIRNEVYHGIEDGMMVIIWDFFSRNYRLDMRRLSVEHPARYSSVRMSRAP